MRELYGLLGNSFLCVFFVFCFSIMSLFQTFSLGAKQLKEPTHLGLAEVTERVSQIQSRAAVSQQGLLNGTNNFPA